MTARLILICHGSTEAMRAARFPADEPLDDKGESDAITLAGRLPKAQACQTSPELRARQTAQALQLTADVQPLLRDCDYGAWTGRTFDDVQASEPQAISAWLRDPAAAPHGGESLAAMMQRVERWLAVEQAHHRQSIVVTHATIIRAAIVQALEAPLQSFWRIDIAPLSIARLSGLDGRWNVACTGCTL